MYVTYFCHKHTCTHAHVRISQLQILQVILAPMSLKQLIYISLDINCQVKRNRKEKICQVKIDRKESWNWAMIWKVAVNTLHLRSSLRLSKCTNQVQFYKAFSLQWYVKLPFSYWGVGQHTLCLHIFAVFTPLFTSFFSFYCFHEMALQVIHWGNLS